MIFEAIARIHRLTSRAVGQAVLALHSYRANVSVAQNVRSVGYPLIELHSEAWLRIGHDTTLNSSNRGYHLAMFGNVKLMADRPGAEISIGANTRIHGSCIHAQKRISIGDNCLIAANCQIIDCSGHDTMLETPDLRIHSGGQTREIVIEDNVWLGTGVIVLPGVTIGAGSVIGANSVVSKDIPPAVLAAGIPAVVVKSAPS